MSAGGIVLVLSGFPRRSETFALNEALALSDHGCLSAIFATKAGDGQLPQPGSERILPCVRYLAEGTPAQQAQELVRQLDGKDVHGIHAYFAHTPTEVAELAAEQLSVPFGFSVHAKDARKVSPDELRRRAKQAACVVACNPDVAGDLRQSGVPVHLLPHGVDTKRFFATPAPSNQPIQLLAVGRLVEKKGFDVLIHAIAKLRFPLHLKIIGDGPQHETLSRWIAGYNLGDQIELCASMTHDQLVHAYTAAHIVVAPSVVDRNGDRDGLPNVILEALACARPVVASDVAAISSAITTGENGWLTPPGEAEALASALTHLANDAALRQKLGDNARLRAERDFDLSVCSRRFCEFLEQTYR